MKITDLSRERCTHFFAKPFTDLVTPGATDKPERCNGTYNPTYKAKLCICKALQPKTALSGEVFKESYTDIFQTGLEQVAFSLEPQKRGAVQDCRGISWKGLRPLTNRRLPYLTTARVPLSNRPSSAGISLFIRVGDYLSSGDRVGARDPCNPLKRVRKAFYRHRQIVFRCKKSCKRLSACKTSGGTPLVLSYRHKTSYNPCICVPLQNRVLNGKPLQAYRRTSVQAYKRTSVQTYKGTSLQIRGLYPCLASKTRTYGPCHTKGFTKSFTKGGPLQIYLCRTNQRFVKGISFLQSEALYLYLYGISKTRSYGPCGERVVPFTKQSFVRGTGKGLCPSTICKRSLPCYKHKAPVVSGLGAETPIVLSSSGRVLTISKTQVILQKTQPILFYSSANLHVKKGEWVREGAPILTLNHQTLITGDIVQGIPRIEQLFEAFTSPPPASGLKDRQTVTRFKDVHDTLHSQLRDIFRKHWLKSVLPTAVRKSLEEIQYTLVEMIQKVYLSQGVLIADKHIEIVVRQIASKGQILDSGTTGLFLEEVLPVQQIENANLTTPGKKCLYVPAVMGLTASALNSDSFVSAASFQETTRVLSRDAVVGKSDFLRGLKEKVVIGDLISAGTGLDIYFIYTTMLSS